MYAQYTCGVDSDLQCNEDTQIVPQVRRKPCQIGEGFTNTLPNLVVQAVRRANHRSQLGKFVDHVELHATDGDVRWIERTN